MNQAWCGDDRLVGIPEHQDPVLRCVQREETRAGDKLPEGRAVPGDFHASRDTGSTPCACLLISSSSFLLSPCRSTGPGRSRDTPRTETPLWAYHHPGAHAAPRPSEE